MSQDLGGNMESELINLDRIRTVGIGMALDFDIPYRDDEMPYIISDEEMSLTGDKKGDPEHLSFSKEQALSISLTDTGLVGEFDIWKGLVFGKNRSVGSNNWVISGALTTTGSAFLANDAHLAVDMPSIWYEIGLHLQTAENQTGQGVERHLNVRGLSFPGFPGVIVGHNDSIAWGVTTLSADVQDLYVERLNPENPNQYEVKGRWVDMEIEYEHIIIQGEDEPYGMLVRHTRHGPIVTDHGYMLDYGNFGITPQRPFPDNLEFTALALRWNVFLPNNSLKAVIMLNRAQNFDEFRKALSYWDTPSQNFVYADVNGNIGYQAPGLTPIRLMGEGHVPVPGWTDEYEWAGFIPFDKMPFVYNPSKGYIVTANNPIVSENYPYMISRWTGAAYRAKRIVDMIENDSDGISIEDIQNMQADIVNLPPLEILPYLDNITFEEPALETSRLHLLEWDARMDMNSSNAALYGYFWQKLVEKTFKDQLIEKLWPPRGPLLSLVHEILEKPDSPWWDDVTTPDVVETRDEILSKAFETAYAKAVKDLGSRPEDWQWGDVFTLTFRNRTFGESGIGPVESIFNRGPFPMSGGITQVNQASWDYDKPFEVSFITTLRQIIDLGDLSNSLMTHSTGQSGHPTHRHYDDFIEEWRNVEYHPTLWERLDVERNSKQKLVLNPG
jgi:penicillin amidase